MRSKLINQDMKKQIVFAIVAMVGGMSLIGAGCTGAVEDTDHSPADGELKVAATIFPLYDIARTVAGDDADVVLITPPGASPHYYEPTPSLLKELQGTSVIFEVGAGLDDWTNDLTENVAGAEIVDLSTIVDLKETADPHIHEDGESGHMHAEDDHDDHDEEEDDHDEDHEGEDHDDHGHGPLDPHYWLDPMIAKDIAMHVAEELAHHDETNAAAYVERAQAFAADIAAENAAWKQALSGLTKKEIVTFHNAFEYFADHFGFTVVASFEPFAGQEPTPQYLAELQEEIEVHNITSLFLEPQLPASAIEQFAKYNGLSLGVLDPLGGVDERDSYLDLIDYNVRTIIETNS